MIETTCDVRLPDGTEKTVPERDLEFLPEGTILTAINMADEADPNKVYMVVDTGLGQDSEDKPLQDSVVDSVEVFRSLKAATFRAIELQLRDGFGRGGDCPYLWGVCEKQLMGGKCSIDHCGRPPVGKYVMDVPNCQLRVELCEECARINEWRVGKVEEVA